MKISINIPKYDYNGTEVFWEKGSKCEIFADSGDVTIKGNRAALFSLAKQMLYFYYNQDLPYGTHVHLDDFFCKDGWNGPTLILEVLSDDK